MKRTSTKDRILELLRQEARRDPQGVCSGEWLGQQAGVSRNAVWKAVHALRQEGYPIEPVPGGGYRLGEVRDLLNAREIARRRLTAQRLGRELEVWDSLNSTNTYVKQKAASGEGKDGLVVIARQQTAGRGRRERVFHSPESGLYLTVLLCPDQSGGLELAQLGTFNLAAAVAAARAVQAVCGQEAQIKWPNDLLSGGRKLCGILTECTIESESGRVQNVNLGLGFNVNQQEEDFPPELRGTAVSLRQLCGQEVDRAQLAAALLDGLEQVLADWQQGGQAGWLEEYRQRSAVLGQEVDIHFPDGSCRPGRGEDITPEGGLLVRWEDGSTQLLHSGEVSLRLADFQHKER